VDCRYKASYRLYSELCPGARWFLKVKKKIQTWRRPGAFPHLRKGVITSRAVTGSPGPRSRHVNYQPRLIPFGERYLQEHLPCFRSRKADFSIPGVLDIHPSSIFRDRLPMLVHSNKDEKRKLLSTNPFSFNSWSIWFSSDSNLISFWCLDQRREVSLWCFGIRLV
jgi:hypothetical protein